MKTVGENRLSVYNLLYTHPLYEYINQDKEINVLVLGNSWVASEVFKAVFWCGQYPDIKLNITVAAEDKEEYKSSLLTHLPGLMDFADFDGIEASKYHYANICIKSVSFEDILNSGIDENIYSEDCLNIGKQKYIIVDVGDDFTNQYIAQSLSEIASKEAIINVFSVPIEIESAKNINFVSELETAETLKRIIDFAKNINFLYTMKKELNLANKENCDKDFDSNFNKEFIENIVEHSNAKESIKNFLGKEYNADSSIAHAVHSKYKLNFCGKDETNAKVALTNAINTRNELYNQLISWEHRRWNAFMVTRGYRYPTQDELTYLYSNGNTHQDHTNRLHLCMCDCGNEGIFLSNNPKAWDKDFDDSNLSELDRMSLLCDRVLEKRTRNIGTQIKKDLDNLTASRKDVISEETNTALSNFVSAVESLIANNENAYSLYQNAFRKAMNACSEMYKNKVKAINKKIELLIIKSKKTDFYAYDAELVDMLPICLSMNGENNKVVTIIEKVVPTDVLIPCGLFPQKATFVFSESFSDSASYQRRIANYFKSHGNYTKLAFSTVNTSNPNSIATKLSDIIDEKTIICLAHQPSPAVSMAIGRFVDTHPIISLGKYSQINAYNSLFTLPNIIKEDTIGVRDYFELAKWETDDLFTNIISKDVCMPLENFYFSFAEIWNLSIIKHIKEQTSYKNNIYAYILDEDVEKRQIQDTFLRKLNELRIIEEYRNIDGRVKYSVINDKAYRAFAKTEGILFELLVYYKLLSTGLFEDVKTGIKFTWANGVENEIDEIALYNSTPLFISCKTTFISEKTRDKLRGFIYEISSEAKTFNGAPVLTLPQNLYAPSSSTELNIIDRANAMGVAILDGHILQDEHLLKKAVKQIIKGTYGGPVNFN